LSLELPITRFTLGNGLRVVQHVDRRLPLVAVNLWYGVGSRDEHPGRTGLAHLFEHMLFQGSEHVAANDHFRYVQQVGGVANGSTWFDRTNYYETLPAHHLELGLWLESDRLGFLLAALNAEKLETQRGVVLNERRQRIDNQPYGRAFERLHELLYPEGHPYRWPVIGYTEDIEAADLEDVRTFFRRHYVPDNAVLTLAGDFDPETARGLVERYFGEIPAGGREPRAVAPTLEPRGRATETLHDRVELSRVYLGFRCPGFGSREWYAADLLTMVLSGGKSAPFFQDLVYERQIAQSASCWLLPTELDATFAVVATASPDADLDDLEERLCEHLRQAAAGIERDAIERSLHRFQTAWFSEMQSLERRADLLSQFTLLFDAPEMAAEEAARYLELEEADLVDVARRFLDPEHRVTLRIVPEEPSRPNP
jgi:zinc protease